MPTLSFKRTPIPCDGSEIGVPEGWTLVGVVDGEALWQIELFDKDDLRSKLTTHRLIQQALLRVLADVAPRIDATETALTEAHRREAIATQTANVLRRRLSGLRSLKSERGRLYMQGYNAGNKANGRTSVDAAVAHLSRINEELMDELDELRRRLTPGGLA